jgi:dTDP-4-dehydrorhamnose reductase
MRVLVLGSGGQLGFELMRASWPAGWSVDGLAHVDLDITDSQAVARTLRAGSYNAVVNAAGYTAVDRAESDPMAAFAVNRDGAAHVAAACATLDIPLMHISTDYVFDGAKQDPYVEDDLVVPINVYGASKAAGEDEVRRRTERYIILRTSWVYGVHGSNFVKTMLRLGRERAELRVVHDQTGSPTAAADLANAIVQIWQRLVTIGPAWGTYHLCGSGATTWCEFARRILDLRTPGTRGAPALQPMTSKEFGAPARRPANSQLDCRRIQAAFGVVCPPWQESLARLLPEIEVSLA